MGLLAHHREIMEMIYKDANIAIVEFDKDNDLSIQVVLSLLREIYPQYYDLKHFHRRVDMITVRARNKSHIE